METATRKTATYFSYVVSAPLHYQGWNEFWKLQNGCGAAVAAFDVIIHVLFWVSALILDIWLSSFSKYDLRYTRDLHAGALVCTILAVVGLLMNWALGMAGQPAGKAWPSLIGMIVGGLTASVVFAVLGAMSFTHDKEQEDKALMADQTAPNEDVRFLAFAAIALKLFALATVRANIDFWGPCGLSEKCTHLVDLAEGNKDTPQGCSITKQPSCAIRADSGRYT